MENFNHFFFFFALIEKPIVYSFRFLCLLSPAPILLVSQFSWPGDGVAKSKSLKWKTIEANEKARR